MIVCSKRVFLNVLTQLMDANTLLNANYYIADQSTRNGYVRVDDQLVMNDDGDYELRSGVQSVSTLSTYNIIYGDNQLSPESLISLIVSDMAHGNPFDNFKRQLLNPETVAATYRFLYNHPPKGNGLKILIYAKDQHATFMHIVCEYLSNLFGDDITFLDMYYRKDIPGKTTYVGNKQHGAQMFEYIRNYIMMKDIHDISTAYQHGYGSDTNLQAYFSTFSVPEMFGIYEKLWPSDPLPPGNYTKEHITHIITSRLKSAYPRQGLANLMIPSFEDMASLYDGISDEEIASAPWKQ